MNTGVALPDAEGAKPPSGERPGASPAPSEASELAQRRAEARRAWRVWALLPAFLLALTLLDSAPAFLIAVTAFQVLAWPITVRNRRRSKRPGAALLAVTPEGKAWLFGLWSLVLAALFVPNPAVRLLVASAFAVVAASVPLVRANVARATLSRRVERRARAGAPSTLSWRLANPTSKPAYGLVVRDPMGYGVSPAAADLAFDAVPAGGSAVASTTVVFERRGWKRFRPALVTSRFPLGLFSVTYETAAPAETLVWPREGKATAALVARLKGAAPSTGRAVAPRAGLDHFHGLREFRDGDDPRRIHWRTTAKRNQRTLMEWREEQTRRVTVVLGRGPGRGPDADRRFDRAVSVAATVLRAAKRSRLPASLVLGTEGEARGGTDVRDRRRHEGVLDALALVRADAPRRPEAILDARGGALASTLVWVSSSDETDIVEKLRGMNAAGVPCLVLHADHPSLSRWIRGLP